MYGKGDTVQIYVKGDTVQMYVKGDTVQMYVYAHHVYVLSLRMCHQHLLMNCRDDFECNDISSFVS